MQPAVTGGELQIPGCVRHKQQELGVASEKQLLGEKKDSKGTFQFALFTLVSPESFTLRIHLSIPHTIRRFETEETLKG